MSDDILFDTADGAGFITLNRPQALNALTLGMVRAMDAQLVKWADDAAIRAVVVKGAGGRAFCAGGDVKAVALGGDDLKKNFFREEYILNHRIFTYPKPYIALIDGIVMGGGKGISVHGRRRVVTENLTFSVPEAAIGFFPDVGGGHFLPRCPGQTGLYLALTASRVGAADAMYMGFATDFVEAKNFPALCAEKNIDAAIKNFSGSAPGVSLLAQHRAEIDRCFSYGRMEDIIAALEKEKTPWAADTLKAMNALSPTSLKVALKQIRLGAGMSFSEVMTMEYRLSQHFMKGHDFHEGIRAALIDKDRKPRWNPAAISDVSDTEVAAYFQSLGKDDLVF